MHGESELAAVAERVVAMAVRAGADKCDVLAAETLSTSVDLEKGSVKQANIASDPGVGVRTFIKGSPGFAYCTGFEEKAMASAVEMAVSLSRAGTADPAFKDLPHAARPRAVGGLYERRLSEIGPDEVVRMVIDMADIASDDKRVSSANASAGVAVCHLALSNSNGFTGSQRLTSMELVVEAVARDGDAMFSGYDGVSSRRLEADAIERIGKKAREQALKGLAQTKIETGDYPVVVDPLAMGFILSTAIAAGANAENVQRGRSYLAGRLGQAVAAPAVSMTDDPTVPWGTGSTSFDGEGVPANPLVLVDGGVLRSYLHDSYTSGKEGRGSTGNSSRGSGAWSFRHAPSVSTSNLVVGGGDSGFEEMVSETRSGVYLRGTWDYPNLATGEFSALMMESYVIRDGELGPALKQSTVGVGMVDMMSRVDMLGKSQRTYFGVTSPFMRISSARIGGSN
jgi:PmbA protein